jgi:hypothetical protein
MTAHCSRAISHSYFVALIDYGPHYPGKRGPSGFAALEVDPEKTRQNVIDEIRDIQKRGSGELVHVKSINGNDMEDVTPEFIAAIRAEYVDVASRAWDEARRTFRKLGAA